jgi:hypothetical protein
MNSSSPVRVNVRGHGVYFRVNGRLYTTPTPRFYNVPVELNGIGVVDVVAGPVGQLSPAAYGPAR